MKKKMLFRKCMMPFIACITLIVLILQPGSIMAQGKQAGKDVMYLSDLNWEQAAAGWRDVPNKDISIEKNKITLTDNNGAPATFDKGIGTHANSEMIYDISGSDYKYFTSWVGVDREVMDTSASIQFKVYVDGKKCYESHVMKDKTAMEYAKVDITGAKELKLMVTDGGDGNAFDHGDWADAKLHYTNPVKSDTKNITPYDGMKLVFHDEFQSDELNTSKWRYSTTPENGTHHYANKTGKDGNIWVEDGNLVLQAKKYKGDGNYSSTSGAISTENQFHFRYGRVDVRAKIPTETGMWPAIWMMPAKPDYGWPMSGEIDIMELISNQPNKIWSTIHSGIANKPAYYFKAGDTLTIERGTYYDDYHVYSMDWQPHSLSFYVDDKLVAKIDKWDNWVMDPKTGDIMKRDYPAPFNKPFFLKLNLATGGWSQDVDEQTRWGDRTSMKVDYVRVYQDDIDIASISDLKDLIKHYDDAGDFANKNAVHQLNIHLTALQRFEQKGENQKVMKHLEGFKRLLSKQKKEEEIFVEAYDALMSGANTILDGLK